MRDKRLGCSLKVASCMQVELYPCTSCSKNILESLVAQSEWSTPGAVFILPFTLYTLNLFSAVTLVRYWSSDMISIGGWPGGIPLPQPQAPTACPLATSWQACGKGGVSPALTSTTLHVHSQKVRFRPTHSTRDQIGNMLQVCWYSRKGRTEIINSQCFKPESS